MKRALLIFDAHVPFEHKPAYKLMLQCAKSTNIDEVIIGGDFADFYNVSFHERSPDVNEILKDELFCVKGRLAELRQTFPRAKITYIVGNHENRLKRYIESEAKALTGIISLESFLDLEKYVDEVIPYGPYQKYQVLGSKLYVKHEPNSTGQNLAHLTVTKCGCSVIFGHCHKIQESQIILLDGSNLRGISCGWLGDKNHEVFQYVKNHSQWALAFSIISVINNNLWFNQMCHIIETEKSVVCQFDGRIYEVKK